MNGLCVMPKIAGIESIANRRSVTPIAAKTMIMGVNTRLPSMRVSTFLPSYASLMGSTRRSMRTMRFSRWVSSSWSSPGKA